MTRHPNREQLAAYREGILDPVALLKVDDHVATCRVCRTSAAAAVRGFAEALAGEHLTADTMEGRVDGQLTAGENAQVERHLAICSTCASEIADLAEYAAPRSHSWRWLAAAAAILVIAIAAIARWGQTAAPIETPKVRIAEEAVRTPAATIAADPLESLDPELRKVAEQLQAGTIASAKLLASLHRAQEQQRGPGEKDAVRVTEPVGVVVESARPTFRWTPAANVVVQVFDEDYALVVESPRLTGTSWRPPAPLARGRTYRWQLALPDDSVAPAPPAPPALMHVLGAKAFAELSNAQESGATLEAGLICVREGLLEEAARLLTQYAKEHPSDVAERLAKNVRTP